MVLLKLNVHEIVVENWVLTVKSNHWNIYRISLAMVRYLSLWLDISRHGKISLAMVRYLSLWLDISRYG